MVEIYELIDLRLLLLVSDINCVGVVIRAHVVIERGLLGDNDALLLAVSHVVLGILIVLVEGLHLVLVGVQIVLLEGRLS